MARNRFIEIIKFLRFDYKQTRSHRLATDKLALISQFGITLSEIAIGIINRVPTLPWMSNFFLPKLDADSRNTSQISSTNLTSNFG